MRSTKECIMYLLWYLLIGLFAGCMAGLLVRGRSLGLLANLIVGIAGGVLGGWLLSLFGWVAYGSWASLITAFVGAVVLLGVVALVSDD
jgi:uncharacterized membrane protein YeaQ/YmgE (transglycosylase-associated protein family)